MKKIIKNKKVRKSFYYAILLSSFMGLVSCGKEVGAPEVITIEDDVLVNEITEELPTILGSSTGETAVKEIINIDEEPEEIIEEPVYVDDRKLVAITFDDGPSKYTKDVVDILNENGVNATFFVVGSNIDKYSDSVQYAYESGNEIGIHTYSHKSFTKMTIQEILDELNMTRDLLIGYDIEPSNLVRPPYGSINDTIKQNVDYPFICWSVDTRDWESRDKESIKAEVYAALDEGDILLFHDMYSSTVEAIRELIPEMSDEYRIVTVSDLFELSDKELEPHKVYRRLP